MLTEAEARRVVVTVLEGELDGDGYLGVDRDVVRGREDVGCDRTVDLDGRHLLGHVVLMVAVGLHFGERYQGVIDHAIVRVIEGIDTITFGIGNLVDHLRGCIKRNNFNVAARRRDLNLYDISSVGQVGGSQERAILWFVDQVIRSDEVLRDLTTLERTVQLPNVTIGVDGVFTIALANRLLGTIAQHLIEPIVVAVLPCMKRPLDVQPGQRTLRFERLRIARAQSRDGSAMRLQNGGKAGSRTLCRDSDDDQRAD